MLLSRYTLQLLSQTHGTDIGAFNSNSTHRVLTSNRVNAGAEVEPSCHEDTVQPTPVSADAASKNRHWNQFRLNLEQTGCREACWQGGVWWVGGRFCAHPAPRDARVKSNGFDSRKLQE